MEGRIIWLIIAAVAAVIGGLVVYFIFLNRKNNEKFKGFLGWLYDFLTFKKMLIEDLLKIIYIISAMFITLGSFAAYSPLQFFLVLIVGNIAARISFEFALMLLIICRNTTEINSKLTRKELKEAAEEKVEK